MADIAPPSESLHDGVLLSPAGMRIDFKIDDGFVDVDTLLKLDDTDGLLGTIYSPFRSETLSGLSAPSALDNMISCSTSSVFANRNFQSPAGSNQRDKSEKMSPPFVDQGHYRRSARLTPSRLLKSPGFLSSQDSSDYSSPVSTYGRYDNLGGIAPINFGNVEPYTPGLTDSFSRSVIMSQPKSRSMKKEKKSKSKRDNRTMTAPKRGEYKCGKCGFFPKKTKHNCDEEKQKRSGGGSSSSGSSPAVVSSDAVAGMMATAAASPSEAGSTSMDGVYPHDVSPHVMEVVGSIATPPTEGGDMDYNSPGITEGVNGLGWS